jgi:hypothetical protein
MSKPEPLSPDRRREYAAMLDSFIELYYQHILQHIAKHAKLGDLLKMIELRQKLMPDNSDLKEFWDMVERVRRQHLPSEAEGETTVTQGNASSKEFTQEAQS